MILEYWSNCCEQTQADSVANRRICFFLLAAQIHPVRRVLTLDISNMSRVLWPIIGTKCITLRVYL